MAKIIGTVKSISGKASVTRGGNQVHPLKAGEVLHENDIIQTLQAGAKVVLTLEGGRELTLNGNDQILLDESVFAVLEEGEVIDGKALHQLIADKFGNPAETAAGDTTTSEANAGAEYASRNDARGSADSSGAFMDDESSALGVNFNAIQNENFQPVVSDVSEITAETDGIQTFSGELEVFDPDNVPGSHIFQQTGDATVVASNEVVQVTDFSVEVDPDGAYRVNGNFDALAAGETATVTFTYTATDNSGADNATSEAKTVTLTVTGTNDQPVVSDVNANITGSASFVGLNELTTVQGESIYLNGSRNWGQAFVAEDSSLSKIQLNMYDTTNNNMDAQARIVIMSSDNFINDSQTIWQPTIFSGPIVYDETISLIFGTDHIVTVDTNNLELTLGEQYYIVVYPVSGDYFNIYVSQAGTTGDGVALTEISDPQSGSGYIHGTYNLGIALTYGNGATVFSETSNTQTISPEHTLSELSGLTDVDTSDTHTFQLAADTLPVITTSSGATVTDLQVVITNENTGTYSISGNFDALAEGETATVTFQYVANDGKGFDGTDGINESSISEPKTVTLTVTGTNDAPVVSTGTVETGNATEDMVFSASFEGDNTSTGSDTWTFNYAGGNLSIAMNTISPNTFDTYIYLYDENNQFIASNDDGGPGLNSLLTLTLSAGTYTVVASGWGGYKGSYELVFSDTVSMITVPVNAIVNAGFEATGTVAFTDVDLTDTHTVSFTRTEQATDYSVTMGTFSAVETTDTTGTGTGGLVSWTYNLDNAAAQELAEGQVVTEVYTIAIEDNNGAITTQDILITITGTNDAPVVSEIIAPTTNEDAASFDILLLDPLKISDVDTHDTLTVKNATVTSSDGHTVVFTLDESSGLLTINPDQFTYLAATESIDLTVNYQVFDGTVYVNNTATVKINGINDAPVAIDDIKEADFDIYTVNLGGTNGWSGAVITATGGDPVYSGNKVGVKGNNPDSNNIDNSGNKESVQFTFNNVMLNQATVVLSGFNTSFLDFDTAVWSVYNGTEFIASGTSSNTSTLVIDTGTQFFNTLIIGTPTNASTSDFMITSVTGNGLVINSDLTVTENQSITIDESYLLSNDSDEDSTLLNITNIDTSGTIGVVSMDADGNVTYNPAGRFDHLNAGEIATDTFTYTLSDGDLTDTATVTINIIGTTSLSDSNTNLSVGSLFFGYDGGEGYDSVTLPNITNFMDVNFEDLSSVLHNIENLNLEGGHKTLTNITPDAVQEMTDANNVLKISGEADDTLELSGFTKNETASNHLDGYNVYSGTSTGGAEITLHIDQDITHIIP